MWNIPYESLHIDIFGNINTQRNKEKHFMMKKIFFAFAYFFEYFVVVQWTCEQRVNKEVENNKNTATLCGD